MVRICVFGVLDLPLCRAIVGYFSNLRGVCQRRHSFIAIRKKSASLLPLTEMPAAINRNASGHRGTYHLEEINNET